MSHFALVNEILDRHLHRATKNYAKAMSAHSSRKPPKLTRRMSSLADELERCGPLIYQLRTEKLSLDESKRLRELRKTLKSSAESLDTHAQTASCLPMNFFVFKPITNWYKRRFQADTQRLSSLLDDLELKRMARLIPPSPKLPPTPPSTPRGSFDFAGGGFNGF
ncbi:hypothetical protein TeGR_g943 [Tetraparma gracilis]|jgi:hypothetical protein|uniref:Uncharacterized protein n=1 Tax=Tetraparma gracilis TaxID=2962635 RepID=A0ABQ6N2M6_9STRA|nr:hypothetical protein TeGR_g943 [Tetraparma gracilis]